VEGDSINDGDKKERPMCPPLRSFSIMIICYREEDVCCFGKVGKGVLWRV